MSLVLKLVAIGSEEAEENDEMTKKSEQLMAEQTALSETKESKEIESAPDKSQNSSEDAKDKLKGLLPVPCFNA